MDDTRLYSEFALALTALENIEQQIFRKIRNGSVTCDILSYRYDYINTYFHHLPKDIVTIIHLFMPEYYLVKKYDDGHWTHHELHHFCDCSSEICIHVLEKRGVIGDKNIYHTQHIEKLCNYTIAVDEAPCEIIHGTDYQIHQGIYGSIAYRFN